MRSPRSGNRPAQLTLLLFASFALVFVVGCGPEAGDGDPTNDNNPWAQPSGESPPGFTARPGPGAPPGDQPGQPEDPSPPADDEAQKPDPPPAQPDPEPQPRPGSPPDPGPVENCNATASGQLVQAQDSINYSGQPVAILATHVLGQGCLSTVELTFTISGMCPLKLQFSGHNGPWKLAGGTLRSDPQCGQGWGSGKTYSVNVGGSAGTLTGIPGSVKAPGASKTCTSVSQIGLSGEITVQNGNTVVDLSLSSLAISGALLSIGSSSGACGEAPEQCVGVECGKDQWGFDCGSCGAGMMCQSGSCIEAVGCLPATGKQVGDQIGNTSWKDSNGQPLALHDYCGTAKAILLFKTAGW